MSGQPATRGSTLPVGGGGGRGGETAPQRLGATLPARGGSASTRAGATAPAPATAPTAGGAANVARGGTARAPATRGGAVPRGGSVRGGGGTAHASQQPGQHDPNLTDHNQYHEELAKRIDSAAVAKRTLGVPIAEVVRNHHERLALLEEKVRREGYWSLLLGLITIDRPSYHPNRSRPNMPG